MALSAVITDPYTPRQIGLSIMDYVDSDGVLRIAEKSASVMVRSENDLDEIPSGIYKPGTIAYTAGFKELWQLDADGEWVSLKSEV